jgi:hypothetical protein
MEEELIRTKQEHQGCQDYIDNFTIQINSKIEVGFAKGNGRGRVCKGSTVGDYRTSTGMKQWDFSNKQQSIDHR